MRWDPGAAEVAYSRKAKKGQPGDEEQVDPLDFLAWVIAHVPEPRLHMVRYLGHSSNVSRGRRRKGRDTQLETTSTRDEPDGLTPARRRARRRAWAHLLRRVYEVNPLT